MSGEPQLVNSTTLKRSLADDIKEAQYAAVREDYAAAARWIAEANVTANELLRRAHLRVIV